MIATIAEKKSSAIAAIIAVTWKPLCSDRWDRNFPISAIVIAAVAGKWFPYDHYDRSDRWTFFFFFSDRSDCSDHMETRLKWTTFYHVLSLQKFASIDKSVKLTGLLMSIRPTFFVMKPSQETQRRLRNNKPTTAKTTLFIHGVLSTKQCSPMKPCATTVNNWTTKYINSKRSKLSTLRILNTLILKGLNYPHFVYPKP